MQNRATIDDALDALGTTAHDDRGRASWAKIEDAQCDVEDDEWNGDQEGDVIHDVAVVETRWRCSGNQ